MMAIPAEWHLSLIIAALLNTPLNRRSIQLLEATQPFRIGNIGDIGDIGNISKISSNK